MQTPRILIKATNVELGPQLERQVRQRLAPLTRVFKSEDTSITIQLRKAATEFGGDMHFVAIKLMVGAQTYNAVAAKPYLNRAITAAADMLRRTASRGASVSPFMTNHEQLKDEYTLTL